MNTTIICKECGVELEDDMQVCPLCDTPVVIGRFKTNGTNKAKESATPDRKKKHLLSQILWQIAAILLISGIAATLIINLAIQRIITWSVYPISVCLIVLSYASLISLWRTRIIFQLAGGWILSTVILVILNVLIQAEWPLKLALPILCAVNIVILLLIAALKALRTKGLNIFAITLLGIAVLCLALEAIISFYHQGIVKMEWSAIVAACLLPVTIAILFMYFRTRNNNELKKIFHT